MSVSRKPVSRKPVSKKSVSKSVLIAGLFAAASFVPLSAAPTCDTDNGGLTLPQGFCAEVVANDLGTARHLAVAANGDLYVALQGEGEKGGVVALRDTNGDGKFDQKEHFGSGSLTGIALHNGYLYVAGRNTVLRWKMTAGRLKPAGEPETVVMGLEGVRQHGDKGITFDGKGGLYVNVGAPSNACQQNDRKAESKGQDPCPILEMHGGIWKFDENKLGQKQTDGQHFATGLRQMPAIAWGGDALYITMNSRDSLDQLWPGKFTAEENQERPAEPMFRAVADTSKNNFGWPYCFWDFGMKKFITMPEYGGDGKTSDRCGSFTPPVAAFPAHWAPVDMMFYTGSQFPAKYKGGAFIAFHGSWNRAPSEQKGYNITFQPIKNGKADGNYEVFADGFKGGPITDPTKAVARPDGVAQGPDGSLYIGDSQKGKIWRVMYKK